MDLTTQDWYKEKLEYVGANITTTYKEARELVMKRTHEMGVELLTIADRFANVTSMAKQMAADLGNLRWWHTIYNSIRIAQKWPNFEDIYKLQEGENVSLHKLVHKYLPETIKDKQELVICERCGSKVNPNRLQS